MDTQVNINGHTALRKAERFIVIVQKSLEDSPPSGIVLNLDDAAILIEALKKMGIS